MGYLPIEVPWKLLAGFMTEDGAIDYVKRQGVQLTEKELEDTRKRVREARSHVGKLPSRRDLKPGIQPIPQSMQEHLASLELEPTFKEHTQGSLDSRFALVEVGKLVAFQTILNVEYLDSLMKQVPKPSDSEETLKFCLPSRKEKGTERILNNFNPDTNTFSVITDNLDFRIVGNVQGEDSQTGRRFLGFAFGGGLRQMSVAQYQDRFILKNGYHRACALEQAGHRFIPVLIVKVPSFELTGANRPGFFPVDVVTGDKPPTMSDFLGPSAIEVRRLKLKLIVSIHAEVQAIPV